MRSRLIDRLAAPEGIQARFQPIFDLRSEPFKIVAAEGLSRGPERTNLATPDVLFEYARRKREEATIDRAAVRAILRAAVDLPVAWDIHLNVHATTIVRDDGFADFLSACAAENGLANGRLVVELLEHWAADVEESRLLSGLDRLRAAGARIALDDVGAGVSNLGLILMTNPSLLKVDRTLVHGIAGNARLSAALRSVRVLAREIGAEIVVEGVEERVDLDHLRGLGIELAQGYLLARPVTASELAERAEQPVEPAIAER